MQRIFFPDAAFFKLQPLGLSQIVEFGDDIQPVLRSHLCRCFNTDADLPLWRVEVLTDNTLVFAAHPAIADGLSTLAFQTDLLNYVPENTMLLPIEKFMSVHPSWRKFVTVINNLLSPPAPLPLGRFSASETAALSALSRAYHTTPTCIALQHMAIAVISRILADDPKRKYKTISSNLTISPRGSAHVSNDVMGDLVSAYRSFISVSSVINWEAAARYSATLKLPGLDQRSHLLSPRLCTPPPAIQYPPLCLILFEYPMSSSTPPPSAAIVLSSGEETTYTRPTTDSLDPPISNDVSVFPLVQQPENIDEHDAIEVAASQGSETPVVRTQAELFGEHLAGRTGMGLASVVFVVQPATSVSQLATLDLQPDYKAYVYKPDPRSSTEALTEPESKLKAISKLKEFYAVVVKELERLDEKRTDPNPPFVRLIPVPDVGYLVLERITRVWEIPSESSLPDSDWVKVISASRIPGPLKLTIDVKLINLSPHSIVSFLRRHTSITTLHIQGTTTFQRPAFLKALSPLPKLPTSEIHTSQGEIMPFNNVEKLTARSSIRVFQIRICDPNLSPNFDPNLTPTSLELGFKLGHLL
ncbi:hypothetical protein C8J57DRAFT_1608813 [Mycena rebaudengoi]|nr:hypothetical protein C8J57DRAFT_1608813 [Mycena rebaudengoi]